MKVRQNLYIDRTISDALEALASHPGGNRSHLVNDALADWLERRGSKKLDDLFKVRLDRMSREQERIRRDIEVVLESLSLFVRYQLTVTAPGQPRYGSRSSRRRFTSSAKRMISLSSASCRKMR